MLKLVLGVFVIVMFSASSSFAQFPDLGKAGSNKTSAASTLSKNIPLDLKSSQRILSALTQYASALNKALI